MAPFDLATGGRAPATTIIDADEPHVWTTWGSLRGRDALVIRDGRRPLTVDPEQGGPIQVVRRGDLGLFWCRGFLGDPFRQLPPPSRNAAAGAAGRS